MLLRARTVLPVATPPIEDGAVLVQGDRIASVGRWADLRRDWSGPTEDLGEAILLPGLINAHCHLDYTDMAGQLVPGLNFTDWIKTITMLKGTWTAEDYRRSWLNGATQLLRNGTTSVVDIEAMPALLPELLSATPLRVHSLLEMTGVRSRLSPVEMLAETERAVDRIGTVRRSAGLSPHAPYSTVPELLRLSGELARRRGWLVCTHVAESQAEFDMFMYRRGPMFDWLKSQRDPGDCGHGSPVRAVASQGLLGPNFIAAHVNHLWIDDARSLAESGSHVVHCPSSRAYFGHKMFPFAQLVDAGVNVCLGTDSAASLPKTRGEVPSLNLFDEMRIFAANHVGVSPETIVRMATMNGAKAMGRSGDLGQLTVGTVADLAVIGGSATKDRYEAVVCRGGGDLRVMIGGEWVAVAPIGEGRS
jgi:cytosine/adenosine deaminase-related metal-dependent hydrolase